ncbi:MAG: class I tRNA ligase family protein [Candidatus Gracilibacteria bacterium]|nr:class I tRNA ligase family protein [Candidatus Gracilibacteria bacterium]
MERYDFSKIEKKWQDKWDKSDYAEAKKDSDKEKFYILDMFPYPSGDGLHMGHMENYTATDIYSRFQRMKGYNVLHPMGWDAFGLPSENYAIKTGIHPQIQTPNNIKTFTRQIKSLGFGYDWSREINTSVPEYYKWTQWFFLFLYENGLAYKKKAKVNWCNSCQTVLANEQAEGGICERCKNEVIQKDLEQWFFKITDFAEDLIDGLDTIDWPSSTIAAQKFWIGKSEGVEFDIGIKDSDEKIKVYTTRIDTVFGMTYIVISPESPLLENLRSKIENTEEVQNYIKETSKKTELERTELNKEKSGVELKGIVGINPFNGKEVKVFIGDYVLSNYGTGAVMAVPAHDERDFEFAKKYDLDITQSVAKYFKTVSGKDAVRDGAETITRKTVFAVIKHWKEDKILCLDWEKYNWKTFVIGGVEEGENMIEAAIREIKEETGYQNVRFVRELGGEVISNFYAEHKGVNRIAQGKGLYFELMDDEFIEPLQEEKDLHKAVFIDSSEVPKFINLDNHLEIWNRMGEEKAFTDDGIVINSEEFSLLTSEIAREKMGEWLENKGIGKRKTNYKLRDWLISRQRYWGSPIPIIYCKDCGEVPVPEKDLPVVLPTDVDFKPTGESPLVNSKTFHDVNCPKCGKKARRESDTMDTFVCSSWYYFRFADTHNENEFCSSENIDKWLPVDMYMGGAEHTVLHLLYARFFTKALQKYGKIKFNEPFLKLRHQGMVLAEDGRKMSKSLGNVVNPDTVTSQFGADSTRMFVMFMGALEDMKPWNSNNIIGIKRFIDKVWNLQEKVSQNAGAKDELDVLMNKTIKKVGDDTANFGMNTAISQLMIFTNALEKENEIKKEYFEKLLVLLSPYAPHLTEELWESLGHKDSIHLESWPKYDESKLIDKIVKIAIQVNGKVRDEIEVDFDTPEENIRKIAFECENVKKHIGGAEIRKVVYVKNKLLSIVV